MSPDFEEALNMFGEAEDACADAEIAFDECHDIMEAARRRAEILAGDIADGTEFEVNGRFFVVNRSGADVTVNICYDEDPCDIQEEGI
jgi:hypothetical protein